MIVFDLRCADGHVFEAWFALSAVFDGECAAGRLRCPICNGPDIEKAVMAPSVAARSNKEVGGAPAMKAALHALARAQAESLASSRWVGDGFSDQARAMHLGEAEKARIHGRASLAEARALVEEGVPVAPLPLPVIPPKALN